MLRLSNVRIGTKLAVMSVLGIALIAGMIASQMLSSASIRSVSSKSSASLVKARDLEAIEAAERGMQVAVGDIRFADGGGDLQKGGKLLEARQKSVDALLDPMIAKSAGSERDRLRHIKKLIDDYAVAGKAIVALKLKSMSADDTNAALKATTEAQDKFKQLPPIVAAIEQGIATLNNLGEPRSPCGFRGGRQELHIVRSDRRRDRFVGRVGDDRLGAVWRRQYREAAAGAGASLGKGRTRQFRHRRARPQPQGRSRSDRQGGCADGRKGQ